MAIHYIDGTDGSDATGDDTNINTPRLTWPISYTAGDTYSGQGGTEVNPSALLNITVDNVTFNSYGTGQCFIDPTTTAPEKTIRIAGANTVIDNLKVGIPNWATGAGRQCIAGTSAALNLTITNCTLVAESVDEESRNITLTGSFPVNISNNHCSGANTGIVVSNTGTATGNSSISNNTIVLSPNTANYAASDGIQLPTSGTNTDYQYNLHIAGNDISNFAQNAIDLVYASNVLVHDNIMHDYLSNAVNAGSAILCGASAGGSIAGGSRIYGNEIYNIFALGLSTPATGLGSRGGHDLEVYNNIIHDCDWGIYNGVTASIDNSYYNNVITDCDEIIRVADSVTGIVFNNNICVNADYGVNESLGTMTYANNVFYNVTNITNGTPDDLGGNQLDTDPQLSSDHFPNPQGPCIGTGTTLLSTYDFHSRPKVGSGNHIGAKWPKVGGSSVRRKL